MQVRDILLCAEPDRKAGAISSSWTENLSRIGKVIPAKVAVGMRVEIGINAIPR